VEGVDPSVWAGVVEAAAAAGVAPGEFAHAALKRAADAALAMVSIYALVDPRTDEIRYVGQTLDVGQRMKAHRRDKDGSERAAWVSELLAEGLAPEVLVLTEVPAVEADYTEQWFITGLRLEGARLLNRQKVFDLPTLELHLIPPTFAWVEEQARRDRCHPGHIFEKAIADYMQRVEEGSNAAC
jgi:hypothetical protein